MTGRVCAALLGGDESAEGVTRAALARQTRPPDETVSVRDLAEALDAADAHGADWLWLLDRGTRPEPDALDRLLEVVERGDPLPEPALLASRVVTPDGELDPAAAPTVDTRRFALVADTFSHGLIPLRVAAGGSLLVRARAIERPRGRSHPIVWTARLLRRSAGVLVPASVVVRDRPGASLELRARLAQLFSGGLALYEKPWFAFRLLEEAVGAARRAPRAGSMPGSSRADAAGGTRGSSARAPR